VIFVDFLPARSALGPKSPKYDDDDDDDDVQLNKITTYGLLNLLSICVRKTHRLVLKKA
jgi:hypothetical protein